MPAECRQLVCVLLGLMARLACPLSPALSLGVLSHSPTSGSPGIAEGHLPCWGAVLQTTLWHCCSRPAVFHEGAVSLSTQPVLLVVPGKKRHCLGPMGSLVLLP